MFPILAQQYSGFLWILSLRTKVLLLHTDCCLSLHKSTWGSCKSYPCTGNPYCWTLVNPSVGILLDPKTGYTVVSLTCTKSHVGSNKSCPFAHWYFSFLHKSTWVLVHEVAILGMMYAIVGSWCTYQRVCAVIGFFSVQWRVQPWGKWKTVNSLDWLVVGHNFLCAYHICTLWKLGLLWPT